MSVWSPFQSPIFIYVEPFLLLFSDCSLSSDIKAEKSLYRTIKKSPVDMDSSNQKIIAALLQVCYFDLQN